MAASLLRNLTAGVAASLLRNLTAGCGGQLAAQAFRRGRTRTRYA
ncbi:MAG: hypothetical protein RR572_04290 [Raoultibacter sp.]